MIALPRPLRAADAPPPVSFVNDVAPILVQCWQACHGPKKAKGKYRLDTFDRRRKPGSSDEPALTPGKPDASTLYGLLVTHEEDDRMPEKADPLPAGQIETIRRWIAEGGKFDGKDQSASLSSIAPSTKHPDPPGRLSAARADHRPRRPRRKRRGEPVQMDGSWHDWFDGRGPWCCLMVLVGDATGTA